MWMYSIRNVLGLSFYDQSGNNYTLGLNLEKIPVIYVKECSLMLSCLIRFFTQTYCLLYVIVVCRKATLIV